MELEKAYENFILSRKLADLMPKTIINYQFTLTPLVKYLGADTQVESITQENLYSYLATIIDKPISKATKSTYIRHIKVFLTWLDSTYEVQYNFKRIKVPKIPKKDVYIYSDDEFKQILDCVSAETEWIVYRNKAIISLMYDSGLRQSEVCSLKCSRTLFPEKRMTVYGKGNKERIVPLGNVSIYFLKKYLALCPFKSKYVFVDRRGNSITCNTVKMLIYKISKKVPFEFSSHKLRHNFATNYCLDQYERKGQIDIYSLKALLGHSDIETTERYLHLAMGIIAGRESISHLDKILGLEN